MARPQKKHAREAILAATLKLIGERGIEYTTIDDISRTSGISRGTIYKHWKQKDALCLDALNYMKRSWPVFNSGNPRADITGLLCHLALTRKPEAFTRVWPRVMSYSANNRSFAKAFRARVSEGRHAQLVQLLELAKSKGELRKDLNIGIAVDLLLGPILYRRCLQTSMPYDLPKHIVDSFWETNGPYRKRAVATKARGILRVKPAETAISAG